MRSGKDGSDDAALERLEPTCTVLGLFERWESEVAEVQLAPGDLLVLYTDGVTEAASDTGEEFGETRLIELLKTCAGKPLSSILPTVISAVEAFRKGEQEDDITLVAARCRPPAR